MKKETSKETLSTETMSNEYCSWRNNIVTRIEQAKVRAVMGVNAELLALYWEIGHSILEKQEKQGWGKQIIEQLSKDLMQQFPNDRGYSERNLRYMKRFAETYPEFPILQVPLAELENFPISSDIFEKFKISIGGIEFLQVPLAEITWYHHISLLSKVRNPVERLFYIIETAQNGWSRDTMLLQIDQGYIHAVGKSINNFPLTLPSFQSDLARWAFKDPYNFSFLGRSPCRMSWILNAV